MFQNQTVLGLSMDQLPRCEERKQMTLHGKSLGLTRQMDTEIKEKIYEALWKDDVLRALEYYEIDVYVKNKMVHLNGYIVSAAHQDRILQVVQAAMPGVAGVENHLILDDTLIGQVAEALVDLEAKHDCKFFIGALHGIISLNGLVDMEDVKQLAEQCVIRNLDVRGVINNVRLSGDKLNLFAKRDLLPAVGALIYFRDGAFGVIKQVVLNPINRCVVQLVVQGQFVNQKRDLRSLTSGEDRLLEKAIVISANLIRYLTESTGYLTIKSTETGRYKDFNPVYFTTSKTDWVPPYPYCSQDVLFNVDPATLQNYVTTP